MNFKAIFLISILAFSFLAISFDSVSAMSLTVVARDSGNSNIAGTYNFKIFGNEFKIPKNTEHTYILNNIGGFDNKTGDVLLLDAYSGTGNAAKFYVDEKDMWTLNQLFGNDLNIRITIREFKGSSSMVNKIDTVRISTPLGTRILDAGSPTFLDKQKLKFNLYRQGILGEFYTQTFQPRLLWYNDNKPGYINFNEKEVEANHAWGDIWYFSRNSNWL